MGLESNIIKTILQPQFILSVVISLLMAIYFIRKQRKEYKLNIEGIGNLARFFSKKENYSIIETPTLNEPGKIEGKTIKLKNVANDDSELKNLIKDINDYIDKSKGTVAFSIIQNKTERRISMLYEIATSKLSFPTHLGLMGTFAGVFVGLIMFLIGTFYSGGITDSTIQSLITGVLVSMATSFYGIKLLISSHRAASNATNIIDKDKNEFYEWIQNKLMPSVDVSMVEAIGKLHQTIDQFEPTFSGVIDKFKDAFKDVTGAFGDDFRLSVQIIKEAVEKMGMNIDKINVNIDLQNQLLKTIRSDELRKGMEAFVEASKKFNEITGSLDQFEKARRIMLVAAQQSINLQKDFNESLQIPKQVASEINMILNRITTFEKNIEGLGTSIAHTQLLGNTEIEQIRESINAIRSKQKVAEKMADTANEKLEKYFEMHQKELGRIAQKYNEALDTYLNDYQKMLEERKKELEARKREFTQAVDEKFSLEDIRKEFSSLKKLNDICSKLDQLSNRKGIEPNKLIAELVAIKGELIALNEKESKGGSGGFTLFGGGGTSNDTSRRKIQELESLIEDLKTKMEQKNNQPSSSVPSEQFDALQRENEANKSQITSLMTQINDLRSQLQARGTTQVAPSQTPISTPTVTEVNTQTTSSSSQQDNEAPFTQEQLDQWRKEEEEKKELLKQLLADENQTPNDEEKTSSTSTETPSTSVEKVEDNVEGKAADESQEQPVEGRKKPFWKFWK